MQVTLYFDPTCPWSWITSRWLDDVAGRRDLTIGWRSFSLDILNEDRPRSERRRNVHREGRRALRVIEAVRAGPGEDGVRDLYWELGRRFHHDRCDTFDLPGILDAAGLDVGLAEAAEEDAWDARIEDAMQDAFIVAGEETGVPTMVFELEEPAGFYGPIISPLPEGAAALELFDHLLGLAQLSGFFELKRAHFKAEVGERP